MRQLLLLCLALVTSTAWSQKLPKIKGSGIVELQEVVVDQLFNKIAIDGDLEVELTQGATNSYSIETDDNLMEVVHFEIADSTLTISTDHKITKKKKLAIEVQMSDIAHITLSNEAALSSNKTLEGDILRLVAGKSSSLELDLDYQSKIDISLYSDADATIRSKSDSTYVRMDDRAALKLYAKTARLETHTTDNTKLTLDGSAAMAIVDAKENAKVTAKEASLSKVEITLANSADAFINVKEAISLFAQDTAVLQLYGDPEITVTGLKNKAKILKKE